MQIFLAPGAILVRVPSGAGDTWTPATDWGFSYRILDFTLPAMRRPGSLHLNLAKVWLLGHDRLTSIDSGMYLAGFSLTFRPVAH